MAEGRFPEAAVELQKELSINPRYAVAHDNLARVLAALGHHDEAAREQALAAELARAAP
jgi:Tfp pilus assembly protein PilF